MAAAACFTQSRNVLGGSVDVNFDDDDDTSGIDMCVDKDRDRDNLPNLNAVAMDTYCIRKRKRVSICIKEDDDLIE